MGQSDWGASFRQGDTVVALRFSPVDSRRLLSLSWSGTVCQWNIDGHQIRTSYHEADEMYDLAYTPDGTCFVLCGGRTATVRDSAFGAVVLEFDAPDQATLGECCFSPDGRFFACRADSIIYAWDVTISGSRPVGHVEHSNSIAFIAFSSSFISGSYDHSMKIWQSSSFLQDSVTTSGWLRPPVRQWSSPSIYLTGGPKSSFPTPAKGKRGTHLVSDTLVIVWLTGEERECNIWDVYKGQLLRSSRTQIYRGM